MRGLSKRVGICEECGTLANLDIHHKDRDHSNDEAGNLKKLCRSCHAKDHACEYITESSQNLYSWIKSPYSYGFRISEGFGLLKEAYE